MPPTALCTCDRLDRVLGLAAAFCPMHGLEQPGLTLIDLAAGCDEEAHRARADARDFEAFVALLAVLGVAAFVLGSPLGWVPILAALPLLRAARVRRINARMLNRAAKLGRAVAAL